jgi:hypothetical protein
MNVTAMTSAHMLHAEEFRDWPAPVSTCAPAIQPITSSDYLSEGFGNADPVASNDTPHNSAQNRRVELSVPASGRRDFCFAF